MAAFYAQVAESAVEMANGQMKWQREKAKKGRIIWAYLPVYQADRAFFL